VRDAENLLRTAVGEHIELRTTLTAGLPVVRVDISRIEQVLLNLTLNARDAMADGGTVLIETSERHFSDQHGDATTPGAGDYVCISVSDEGSGFTDETRQHAFEPFFTTKPAGRGTGLGLAIVHEIAKDAGGHAALQANARGGATVQVYLPAVARDAAGQSSATGPMHLEGDGRTVLLVEDEPQLRLITARMLERHEYRVRAVENQSEALRLLESDTPIALLLTDVVMPGMSGPQLAEQATTLRPELRILYMSGFPRDLWERGAIDSNLQLLEKPFDAEQMLRKISLALH
jgi:CheY-like chemotaxis protein